MVMSGREEPWMSGRLPRSEQGPARGCRAEELRAAHPTPDPKIGTPEYGVTSGRLPHFADAAGVSRTGAPGGDPDRGVHDARSRHSWSDHALRHLARDEAPEWWDRVCLASAAMFAVAAIFLIWDTHRISEIERKGVIVERLRLPVWRRRRRY